MRKLIVEVCNAHNLMPKDGQGTSSPYVVADFDGQRLRTATKMRDLNPQWDEKLEFRVNEPESMASEVLEINVHNDKKNNGKRSNFLGRLKISGNSFMGQGAAKLVYYPLDKRSVFSQIKGELGLKIYYVDEEPAPTAEEKPKETHAQGGGTEKEAKKDETAPPPAETIIAGETLKSAKPEPEKKENAEPGEEKDKKLSEEKPCEEKSEEEKKPAEGVTPLPKPKEDSNSEETAKTEVSKGPVYRPQAPVNQPSYPADFALKDLDRSLGGINGERTSTYDLVEQMSYLFVRLVKARNLAAKDLNGSSDPYARIGVGNHSIRTRTVNNNLNPMWNQVFAICKEKLSSPMLEISLWDEDVGKDDFLGTVSFDLQEVPKRVPPDSPLAPQWYRLGDIHGQGKVKGDVMLAVWMGTQADEAFPEAWQSDTGGLLIHTRSKVYLSPKLWYLRVNVIEAHDLQNKGRYTELSVKAQLGSQIFRTKTASTVKSFSPFWNEDLVFVAAEPFEENLVLTVEDRVGPNKDIIGQTRVLLHTIEKRTDHRQVGSLWFNLENEQGGKDNNNTKYDGRLHLRLCFDGGYHVLDEAAHLTSDVRPTAKQLWKPALGVLELGILGAKNLMPMKSKDGRGATDAYCVAKYGQKWIRSRTVVDSFSPRWNEQYTWEVFDPCTVLSLGVFDNSQIIIIDHDKEKDKKKDLRIGKVRIRISTLETGRIYTNSYPLLILHQGGIKKMGEIELAVRFSRFSVLNMLQVYTQPLLPQMHYLYPLAVGQQDVLRHTAMKIVSVRLSLSEPPLRQEVVQFMLDSESHMWSMRRSKANWFRIMNILSGPVAVFKWLDNIRNWNNPITTVLVHILFLILVWYPELILPTVFLYMFLIGGWSYRYRPRLPPHMDARLSCAHAVNADELDEEFDTFPTSRSTEIVRMRYDRLRSLAGRIQTVMGDLASQGERFCCLLRWRDPRATAIFVVFCLMAAIVTYMVPFRIIAILFGLYYLRHPRFRDTMPSAPLSFFRRLPALSDRIL